MKTRKICVVTGARADYGLLYWLMREIQADIDLVLQVVVTGMHLSPEFGSTYRFIEADGFSVDRKIEMLLSADTPTGISKSIGLGIIGLSDAFRDLNPDIVVIVGDRFEAFSAAVAASIGGYPIAHLHGGELTLGAIDEVLRHSITKMSHLHFVSTEEYRRRVIQLGEAPDRVFNVGAIGIENIRRLQLLSKKELEKRLGFSLGAVSVLVTYHPATLEEGVPAEQFQAILTALDALTDVRIMFTKANADTNGRIINQMIDEYVAASNGRAIGFTSMGQTEYVSAMKHTNVVIGNSSSGIIEAPSLGVPTVNVGERQKGRVRASSIIDCDSSVAAISSALGKALSPEFQAGARRTSNPYEGENTAVRVKDLVKTTNIQGIVKKTFFDVGVTA